MPTLQSSTIKLDPIAQNVQINVSLFTGIITCVLFLVGIGLAWGTLKTAVSHIAKALEEIKPDIKDLREKMAVLWQDKLAPAHSPRQLNELGTKILEQSGIKTIVENKKEELLARVRSENAQNPYDAEIAIQKIMLDLPNRNPELVDQLKNGAFGAGVDVNTVLFVGSIYLRNLIFIDLGFSLDDLSTKIQNPSAP